MGEEDGAKLEFLGWEGLDSCGGERGVNMDIYRRDAMLNRTEFFNVRKKSLEFDIPYLPEYKSIPCISRPPIFEAIN